MGCEKEDSRGLNLGLPESYFIVLQPLPPTYQIRLPHLGAIWICLETAATILLCKVVGTVDSSTGLNKDVCPRKMHSRETGDKNPWFVELNPSYTCPEHPYVLQGTLTPP